MTQRLILIRHAKSSWDDPFSDDHARVLNERGRKSASAIGEWLAKKGYVPDLILCSDAARTRETADLIMPSLVPAPTVRLSSRLYHAGPDVMMDLIRQAEGGTVGLIGHNPGIGMLAWGLVAKAPEHARFADYPTGAVTVIDLPGDSWSTVRRGSGKCVDFVVPRDLIGTSGNVA